MAGSETQGMCGSFEATVLAGGTRGGGSGGPSLAWEAHAGSMLSAADLMVALIADRLERTVDRMLLAGQSRLGLMGRSEHLQWLFAHVHGMSQLPVMAFVSPPGVGIEGLADPSLAAVFPARRPAGVPDAAWYELSAPTLPDAIDALLVCDDRHQQACLEAARLTLPPRVSISRLYDRLPIGNEPLDAQGQADQAASVVVRKAAIRGVVRVAA